MADHVSITLTQGDSKKFLGFPRKGKATVRGMSHELNEKLGKVFLKHLRKQLREDGLDMKRLTRYTISRKRAAGMKKPNAPMYGQGADAGDSYYSLLSMVVKPNSSANKSTVRVGAIGNRKHHSGISIVKLAIMHAKDTMTPFGLRPARNPVLSAYKSFDPKEEAKQNFKKSLDKWIKRILL